MIYRWGDKFVVEPNDDERGLMPASVDPVQQHESHGERQTKIVDVLVEAFSELMAADPDAFRSKFRKMAANPLLSIAGARLFSTRT